MIDELQKAVDLALTLGGEFADARFENHKITRINVVNGSIRNFTSSNRKGIAIRVKMGGAWGLASTTTLDLGSNKASVKKAIKLAKGSSGYSKQEITLPKMPSIKRKLKAKVKIHHDSVGTEEKLRFVLEVDAAQKNADKRIVNRTSNYAESMRASELVNSFGCELSWEEVRTYFGTFSVAFEAGRREFSYDIKRGTAGYELVKETDPNEFGDAVARDAVAMLSAAKPPSGLMTVVVGPGIAGVLAHEVMGHASEADEVIRQRSFLADAVGKRVASDLVTMVDDGTIPKANGSIPFDTEGTQSCRTVIIKNGIYKGFMHSLETAGMLNSNPTGNARAQDYNRRVMVRMTNTFFEPKDWKLDEIVSDTNEGLLALKAISGMEDPVGGGFQVRTLKGYIIKNGEKKGMIRSFTLTGKALEILKTIDAVGKTFQLRGGNCGKGEGEDWVPASTGGPYIRAKIIAGGG